MFHTVFILKNTPHHMEEVSAYVGRVHPPPPLYAPKTFLQGFGVLGVNPPPPPFGAELLFSSFFFSLSKRLAMYNGYPYSIVWKSYPNFLGRESPPPPPPSVFFFRPGTASHHAMFKKKKKKSCIRHCIQALTFMKLHIFI